MVKYVFHIYFINRNFGGLNSMIKVYENILNSLNRQYNDLYRLNQLPNAKGAYDAELERIDKRICHYNTLLNEEQEKEFLKNV